MKVRVTAGPRKGRIIDWPERQALALVKAKRAERVKAEAPSAGGIVDAGAGGTPVVLHGAEAVTPPPAPEGSSA